MARAERPTEGELEVLRIIWDRGPSTGAEIREAMKPRRVPQSTVASILGVMVEKGQIASVNNMKPNRYCAVLTRQSAFRRMIAEVGHQLFGARGTHAANPFVNHANPEARLPAEEIEALKKLLDQASER